MQTADLAWVAGIVDGEGTITFNKSANPRVRKGFIWAPKVTVDNTSQQMLERVLSTIGYGRVRLLRKQTERWKPLYRYELLAYKEIRDFLGLVRPHLTVKRQQAEYVMEAVGLLLEVKGARTNPTPGLIRDKRLDTLWRLIRVLNAKSKKIPDAVRLLNSNPLYTREQYEAEMKAFKESYNPKWKTLTYNRERLRQWRLLNPKKYEAQLKRAGQRRKKKGQQDLSTNTDTRRVLIQNAASNLTPA